MMCVDVYVEAFSEESLFCESVDRSRISRRHPAIYRPEAPPLRLVELSRQIIVSTWLSCCTLSTFRCLGPRNTVSQQLDQVSAAMNKMKGELEASEKAAIARAESAQSKGFLLVPWTRSHATSKHVCQESCHSTRTIL